MALTDNEQHQAQARQEIFARIDTQVGIEALRQLDLWRRALYTDEQTAQEALRFFLSFCTAHIDMILLELIIDEARPKIVRSAYTFHVGNILRRADEQDLYKAHT